MSRIARGGWRVPPFNGRKESIQIDNSAAHTLFKFFLVLSKVSCELPYSDANSKEKTYTNSNFSDCFRLNNLSYGY